MKTVICKNCGSEFNVSLEDENIEFCSDDCICDYVDKQNLAYMEQNQDDTERVCSFCGNTYLEADGYSNDNEFGYCCRECWTDSRYA